MRRLVILLAVSALAGFLAACGSDDNPTAPTPRASGPPTNSGQGAMGGDGMMGGASEDTMGGEGGDAGEQHDEASGVAPGAREVRVKARSFAFEPREIRAKVGENLAVVVTSEDILHDFTIDELDAHIAAEAGETERGGLRADRPGRYTFYCTVSGHRRAGMEGVLIVE